MLLFSLGELILYQIGGTYQKIKLLYLPTIFINWIQKLPRLFLAQFPKFSETSLELVNKLQTIFKESSSSVKDIDSQTLQNIQCHCRIS